MTIRLFIIENQPAVGIGLELLLGAETGFCVVGVAANCASALQKLTLLRPDVVILDIDGPQLELQASIAALRQISSQASLVIITLLDGARTSRIAEQACASAVVFKHSSASALLNTIREVAPTEIE